MANPPPTPPPTTNVALSARAITDLAGVIQLLVVPQGMDAAATGDFLGISTSAVHDLNSRGLLPAPVLIGDGRCHRWIRAELLDWLVAGAPTRDKWNMIKQANARRGGAL